MSRADRGVSTVVDVGLCLLLVSAATLALAASLETAAGPGSSSDRADRTADTVAATTASVEYSLEPLVAESDTGAFADVDEYDEDELARVSHGSTGGLVADAAVANVRVDGERLAHAGADFERSLDGAVRGTLAGANDRTQVVALWRPYANASLDGRATVGRTPPPDADVHAATVTVPCDLPAVRADAVAAATRPDGGYDDVAAVVAAAVVEGYFPVAPSQRAVESDGLERATTVNRYRRLATLLPDADPEADAFRSHLDRVGGNASAANAYLIEHLAVVVAADLEGATDSPLEAAHTVSTGNVTLVVRTWEP